MPLREVEVSSSQRQQQQQQQPAVSCLRPLLLVGEKATAGLFHHGAQNTSCCNCMDCCGGAHTQTQNVSITKRLCQIRVFVAGRRQRVVFVPSVGETSISVELCVCVCVCVRLHLERWLSSGWRNIHLEAIPNHTHTHTHTKFNCLLF